MLSSVRHHTSIEMRTKFALEGDKIGLQSKGWQQKHKFDNPFQI